MQSAQVIKHHLMGMHKPIYHPMSKYIDTSIELVNQTDCQISFPIDDCGDHVVVINTADIAWPGDEWEKRVYFHHTGYAGGASWTLAWELHAKDKTLVIFAQNILRKSVIRRTVHCTGYAWKCMRMGRASIRATHNSHTFPRVNRALPRIV